MNHFIQAQEMNIGILAQAFARNGLRCTPEQHDGLVVHVAANTGCGGVSAATRGSRWQAGSTGDRLGAVVVCPHEEFKTLLLFGFVAVTPVEASDANRNWATLLTKHSTIARYHTIGSRQSLIVASGLPYHVGLFDAQILDAVDRFARDIPAAVRAAAMPLPAAPDSTPEPAPDNVPTCSHEFATAPAKGGKRMKKATVSVPELISPDQVDVALVERILREHFTNVQTLAPDQFLINTRAPIQILVQPQNQTLVIGGRVAYRVERRRFPRLQVKGAMRANDMPTHISFSVDEDNTALRFDHCMSYACGLSPAYLEFLIRHTADVGPMVALTSDELHLLEWGV